VTYGDVTQINTATATPSTTTTVCFSSRFPDETGLPLSSLDLFLHLSQRELLGKMAQVTLQVERRSYQLGNSLQSHRSAGN